MAHRQSARPQENRSARARSCAWHRPRALPARQCRNSRIRRLRHAIMTGRFPPGLAVTIRGLAALLEVSAMPVREAMRRLVAERALDILDNRRVRVPAMDEGRFSTLIAARILLEQEAARRALPRVITAAADHRAAPAGRAGKPVPSPSRRCGAHDRGEFRLPPVSVWPGAVRGALLPLIESDVATDRPVHAHRVGGRADHGADRHRPDRHAAIRGARSRGRGG